MKSPHDTNSDTGNCIKANKTVLPKAAMSNHRLNYTFCPLGTITDVSPCVCCAFAPNEFKLPPSPCLVLYF